MECADDRLQMFNSSCYLFVSYPEVTWQTAQQICQGMKVHNNLQQAVVPAMSQWHDLQWYLGQRVTLLTNFSANEDFFRWFSDSANEYGFG